MTDADIEAAAETYRQWLASPKSTLNGTADKVLSAVFLLADAFLAERHLTNAAMKQKYERELATLREQYREAPQVPVRS